MTRRIAVPLVLAVLAASLPAAARTVERPARWAQPIAKPGLPNLHKVSDGLYRGAQPTAEGFRELARMGVKTVVNLRRFHSDRRLLEGTGLGYVHVPMNAWHGEAEDAVAFLKVVGDPARRPVFVHCQHGADRTGTMAAIYRMAVQGWSVDDAVRELVEGGFGFHGIWSNLPVFLRSLDIDRLKREAAR